MKATLRHKAAKAAATRAMPSFAMSSARLAPAKSAMLAGASNVLESRTMTQQSNDALLAEACTNLGVALPEMSSELLGEIVRLAKLKQESALADAARVLSPALSMALAMDAVHGPKQLVDDVHRGYTLMTAALAS